MGGQDADPGEKQELARNAPYRRVEKKVLDLEVPNREGERSYEPHQQAVHMTAPDHPADTSTNPLPKGSVHI